MNAIGYKTYDPKKTAAKGASTGGATAAVTALASFVVSILASKNPDIVTTIGGEAVAVGVISGGILGIVRAIRNWIKNR